MLWNPFRSPKTRPEHAAAHPLAASQPEIHLPFPGLTVADLLQVWQHAHRFVPAAEAWTLVIEQRLRKDFGLTADDPRFAVISALVRSLDPRDRLTGYARSDSLALNLQLARLYIAQRYDHSPTTCAVRTSGNEFILYSIRQDGIAVVKLLGKNFAGLNRALSTAAEIAEEATRQQQREASPRRNPSGAAEDRRNTTRTAGHRHSQMGYARGDAWIQTLATLAYSLVARDKGRLAPEDFARRVMRPLLERQTALLDASDLDCISMDDNTTQTGVGLTGTFRILSDATGWDLPDEQTLDSEIAAAHDAMGHRVADMPPGKTPLCRLRDPAHAMQLLNAFTDQDTLISPLGPTDAGISPRLHSQQIHQMNPLTLVETLLNANMDAVNRLWNSQWEGYKQLVNAVLNIAYNDHGYLHQFIRDVCSASARAEQDSPRPDHIALIDLTHFTRLVEHIGAADAQIIRADIITWFLAGLNSALITGHISNTQPSVFRKTGRRTSDDAKFGIILTGITGEQARTCLVAALRVVWQTFLVPHGFDQRPGLGICAASAPIPPGHVSFDSAVSLIGGVHRQLDALKEANAQNPETVYLFASHDGFAEPRPQSGGTPPTTDLASTVAALVERHQHSVSESAPIDYFALAAPPAAPEPEALAADSGLMPQRIQVS
jgi:hypothetical protein